MLNKLRLALLISAPIVAGAATYAAANGGPDRAQVIQKFDQNGDGALDATERAAMKAEFQAKRAAKHQAMVARFDANRDGTLDAAERAAMREAKATERFQAMDKNGDGSLSLDEFKAGAAKAGGHHHGRRGGHHHRRGLAPNGGDKA